MLGYILKVLLKRSLPLVCVKWRVFSKKELILSQIVLVTYMEWLVLRIKMNYTQTKAGAKVLHIKF